MGINPVPPTRRPSGPGDPGFEYPPTEREESRTVRKTSARKVLFAAAIPAIVIAVVVVLLV
jgi:hypothetical protein